MAKDPSDHVPDEEEALFEAAMAGVQPLEGDRHLPEPNFRTPVPLSDRENEVMRELDAIVAGDGPAPLHDSDELIEGKVAGLDPRAFQSGTSINKPARIRRQGNAHIRRALFLPAIVAAQHEPHVKAFYEKLVGRGKTKMQANVAVMRKLLHAIYGMLKHDRDFEGEKFYAIGA